METIGSRDGFTYWGESRGWGIAVAQHRDSDALTRANFRVIRDDLASRYPDDVTIESCSHWLVGHVEYVLVRPDSPAWIAAEEWRAKLNDYPCADEEEWSREENQESLESTVEFIRSELRWFDGDRERLAYHIQDHYRGGNGELPGLDYTGWPELDKSERNNDRDDLAAALRDYRRESRTIAA